MKRVTTLLCMGLCACDGTETGNPLRPDVPTDGKVGTEEGEGAPDCEEEQRTIDVSERSPLGFSAKELLSALGREYTTILAWQQTETLEYGPETGKSELTIGIEPEGTATYVTRAPAAASGTQPAISGDSCQDGLVVDVILRLMTEGGAFDEAVDAKLEASSIQAAKVQFAVPVSALNGSFEVSFDPGQGFVTRGEPSLSGTLLVTGDGASGSFSVSIEWASVDGTAAGFTTETIAHVPAEG